MAERCHRVQGHVHFDIAERPVGRILDMKFSGIEVDRSGIDRDKVVKVFACNGDLRSWGTGRDAACNEQECCCDNKKPVPVPHPTSPCITEGSCTRFSLQPQKIRESILTFFYCIQAPDFQKLSSRLYKKHVDKDTLSSINYFYQQRVYL